MPPRFPNMPSEYQRSTVSFAPVMSSSRCLFKYSSATATISFRAMYCGFIPLAWSCRFARLIALCRAKTVTALLIAWARAGVVDCGSMRSASIIGLRSLLDDWLGLEPANDGLARRLAYCAPRRSLLTISPRAAFVCFLFDRRAIDSAALSLARFGSGAAFLIFAACAYPTSKTCLALTALYPFANFRMKR
jgi:hypothetical protein